MASFTNATVRASVPDFYYEHIINTAVIDAVYSSTVMRGLMRNESLAGKPSDTMSFPSWPSLTASAVGETTDLSNTEIESGGVTITVGEIGVMTSLSDALNEDDIIAGLSEYGTQLGKAVSDKMDADSAALLGAFSNTVGSDATALSYATHIAALRALEARDVPGPYVSVYHPIQVGQLHADVERNGGSFWAAGTIGGDERFTRLRQGSGSLAGVPVYSTTNVPTGGTTGYYGGMFAANQALGFVAKRESRTEFERDASARLTEIVVTARYGVGELVDAWGQTVISDTTLSHNEPPTAGD